MSKLYNQTSLDAYNAHESSSQKGMPRYSPMGSPKDYQENVIDEFDTTDADSTMKLPVKSHIGRLDEMLDNLRNDIEESKKHAQLIRADIMSIEHTMKENNNEMSRALIDECLRIEKDFRKMVSIEKSENDFLQQQIRQLQQDKMKIQQNCLVLENRVEGSENDVGFKHLLQYRGEATEH